MNSLSYELIDFSKNDLDLTALGKKTKKIVTIIKGHHIYGQLLQQCRHFQSIA